MEKEDKSKGEATEKISAQKRVIKKSPSFLKTKVPNPYNALYF